MQGGREITRADLRARPAPVYARFPPCPDCPSPLDPAPTARPVSPCAPVSLDHGQGQGNPPDPAPVRHGVMIRADG